MKLLKKGAEGDLFLTKWNGKKSILKIRKKKDYRISQLDEKIRKQRTIHEAEIISKVKEFGVSAPLIYQVNLSQFSILMQFVDGKTVGELPPKLIVKKCKQIGNIVGTLHKNGIMHGDLTTSNFIYSHQKIFLIDFGLSIKTDKPEDHAVDLRLFKEILNSAHAKVIDSAWKNFLSGYKSIVGTSQFSKITHLVSVIESRGRYATVV